MINLDDLEAKAKAALTPKGYLLDNRIAISPETILALVKVVRAAQSISDFSTHSAFDELIEALKEIE